MARNINSITVSGRLGADAEVKQWDDGCTIEFSIACNDSKKKGDEYVEVADWFTVRMSRKTDAVAKYLTKGGKVTVHGRMKGEKYEDKDGKARTFYFIKMGRFDDLELPAKGESNALPF